MGNFNFNPGVPLRTNNPSDDQPVMQSNANSEFLIWQQDHFGFGVENGGTHIKNSYPSFADPVVPVGAIPANSSVVFPNAGVADVDTAQYYLKTPKATVMMSALRGFGVFTTLLASGMPPVNPTNEPITPSNQYNIASITQTSTNTATTIVITFTANITLGNDVAFFYNDSRNRVYTYTIVANVLTLTFSGNILAVPSTISIQILQA